MNATEKIESCFRQLQSLDIKPTLTNMETLLQCLYDLRDAYNELKKGEGNDRKTGDSE